MRGWVAAALLMSACASTPPQVTGPAPSSYWPLVDGQVMTFVASAAGGKSVQRIRVEELKGGWYQVGPGQRLRHDADGLFDGKRYLIRRPLRVGATWRAIPQPGVIERFSVVRVGARCPRELKVDKPCAAIEARQNVPDGTLLTRWWYGQGLGLLQVEVYIQQRSGRLNLVSRLSRQDAS